jgi:hypothetical protein
VGDCHRTKYIHTAIVEGESVIGGVPEDLLRYIEALPDFNIIPVFWRSSEIKAEFVTVLRDRQLDFSRGIARQIPKLK